MSALITADIHLTEHSRDEYRWGLFPWLAKIAKEQSIEEVLLLGDLTDAKDHHSAKLVNRLCDSLHALSKVTNVLWLAGNHDYVSRETPFFLFLDKHNGIKYITMPDLIKLSIGERLFMPAGTDWALCQDILQDRDVFAHATFDGAISETGYQLTGVNPQLVRGVNARVISGDIHKQQKLAGGAIEYVGAPYHIHFGDDYTPRLLYVADDGNRRDMHYPAPRKYTQIIQTLAELYRIAIREHDQIKIIAQMRRADLPEWKLWRDAIKEHAEQQGWVLHGPELRLLPDDIQAPKSDGVRQAPEQLVEEYATRQKVSDAHLLIGKALLKEAR